MSASPDVIVMVASKSFAFKGSASTESNSSSIISSEDEPAVSKQAGKVRNTREVPSGQGVGASLGAVVGLDVGDVVGRLDGTNSGEEVGPDVGEVVG